MASLSPRKLRSDFSDFLRGGQQADRNSDIPSLASTSTFTMDSLHVPETPGKSRSRLPFLGRSRKKPLQPTEAVSDVDDSDVGQPAKSAYSLHLHDERLSFASSTCQVTGPVAGQHGSSFLSRLTSRPKAARKSALNAPSNGYMSDSLLPPATSRRSPSMDSIVSQASRITSTTGPKQLSINVLPSSDQLRKDLPTVPRSDGSLRRPPIPPTPSSAKRWSLKSTHDDGSPSNTDTDTRRQKRKTIGSLPHHEHRSMPSLNKTLILPPPYQPPTVPLPATPASSPPTTPLPSVPIFTDPPKSPRQTRPRAQTLSSVSSRSLEASARTKSIHSDPPAEIEDIDTASPERLRQGLRLRAVQVDELKATLIRVTQIHVAEKQIMEKRIATLEKEAARREKEILGLSWLVNNGRAENGHKSAPDLDIDATHNASSSLPSPISLNSLVLQRVNLDFTDEDGAGSSGGESLTSSVRTTRAKRSSRLHAKSTSTPTRQSSLRNGTNSHPESPLPDIPKLEKRASTSSFASSVGSSASSLFIQNNPSTTTLSVIPEGLPPVPKLPQTSSTSPKPLSSALRDPAIIAAINSRRGKEQKSVSVKASSMKSPQKVAPVPTPAAAYAANLKKGQPPTITKMLEGPASSQ